MSKQDNGGFYMRTGFTAQGARRAGFGIEYDNYGDCSFPNEVDTTYISPKDIRFPNDGKYEELCGPVKIIQGKKEVTI